MTKSSLIPIIEIKGSRKLLSCYFTTIERKIISCVASSERRDKLWMKLLESCCFVLFHPKGAFSCCSTLLDFLFSLVLEFPQLVKWSSSCSFWTEIVVDDMDDVDVDDVDVLYSNLKTPYATEL